MLRVLPEWWHSFMLWLDTATIPLWLILVVGGVALVLVVASIFRDFIVLRDLPPFDP